MEECLIYFRQALANPSSVPPWSDWWRDNEDLACQVFSMVDYVRLKHRRLLGARQILQKRGEIPADYVIPSPLLTGSCDNCGERVPPAEDTPADAIILIICPHCQSQFN